MKYLDIAHIHDKQKSMPESKLFRVRPKCYHLERTGGSFKCKRNKCDMCLNVIDADAFGSTGWSYRM